MRLFQHSLFAVLVFSFFTCIVTTRIQAKTDGYHSSMFGFYDNHKSESRNSSSDDIVPTPTDGGIREIIPDKFRDKYQKWKTEFLAGEFGNRQWQKYESNKSFILTIKVSSDAGKGAGTGEFKWNDAGELVGATIDFGNKLDNGYPNPVYFPVLNALSDFNGFNKIKSSVVAATKFAHEFGHVESTSKTSGESFRLQNSLMPAYNNILLKNGYNVRDSELLNLVDQMGGTPVEIWENREYWGETSAMYYLLDRLKNENVYCSLLNKIDTNVKSYAGNYQDRFNEIETAKNSVACKK